MNDTTISWMTFPYRPIIHRGKINKNCLEHGRDSFKLCIEHNYPMEVDLLMLEDGQIVVWRDEVVNGNQKCYLSSMSLSEIREIAHSDPTSHLNQMMTLREFVDLVAGKVGVIFEIKVPYENSPDVTVDAALSVLNGYYGDFSIHSSNPYAIRRVRTTCPNIPIGQISLSFSRIPNVDPEYVRLHREFKFTDIIIPDFLNYDIRDLADEYTREHALTYCQEHKIPLLSWTIKDATEERLARTYCNNYIIEGATDYLG